MKKRGYYGVGIYQPKTIQNIGTLWRSAFLYDADFIFTIGHRYRTQPDDTAKSFKHVPLYCYETIEEFKRNLPMLAQVICIELDSKSVPLNTFHHPDQAIYLLGAEDYGLPPELIEKYQTVQIPTTKEWSMNVSMAGSIVLYDRYVKHSLGVKG